MRRGPLRLASHPLLLLLLTFACSFTSLEAQFPIVAVNDSTPLPPESSAQLGAYLDRYNSDVPLVEAFRLINNKETNNANLSAVFQRGILRSLRQKAFLLSKQRSLRSTDIICHCNIPECNGRSNELTILGLEYQQYCRVADYGVCKVQKRLVRGKQVVDQYCMDVTQQLVNKFAIEIACHSTESYGTSCCKDNLCNVEEKAPPAQKSVLQSDFNEEGLWRNALFITLAVATVIIFILLTIIACLVPGTHHDRVSSIPLLKALCAPLLQLGKKKMKGMSDNGTAVSLTDMRHCRSTAGIDEEQQALRGLESLLNDLESTIGSGSGSGAPLLAQRTVARQIELVEKVGKGKYGDVYRGRWRGEYVAVKIFDSKDERSWSREMETFNTNMLRHANILRFIAADNKDTGSETQLWLVTEFHPHGSLFEYITRNPIDENTFLLMMRCISNGLAFLHAEIPGMNSKPAIAHRDLKTKNILVKQDLTCVIADFGLAAKFDRGEVDLPENTRSGTIRYMPPELLSEEDPLNHFEMYKAGDIYALSLLMWEVARRVDGRGGVRAVPMEEALAYHDIVSRDPCFDEMREVVCDLDRRPPIPPEWSNSVLWSEISRMVTECWSRKPTARLSALNVRLSISRVAANSHIDLPEAYT